MKRILVCGAGGFIGGAMVNGLARMAIEISGKDLTIRNLEGAEFVEKYGYPCPIGVRGRNSDNSLIRAKLGWDYSMSLRSGMARTYDWVKRQVDAKRAEAPARPVTRSPSLGKELVPDEQRREALLEQ